jgi:ComEC/Rec2-related protein
LLVSLNLKETLTSSIRVIDAHRDSFNQIQYSVWRSGGNWLVTSKDLLDVGKEYLVVGNFQPYSLKPESIKNYQLSLGVVGIGIIKEIKSQAMGCDGWCQMLVATSKLRRNAKNSLYNGICRDNFEIRNALVGGMNCNDIFGLSMGLVLGGTQDFSDGMKANFKQLGLTHLVAVSGFQVVLVMAFLEYVFIRIRMSRGARLVFGSIGVGFLIAIVGLQPPVLRSSISVLLSASVLYGLGRRIEGFRVLIYSALIMLWFNPLYILSLSFQLSFVSSLGLVLSGSFNLEEGSVFEKISQSRWLQNMLEVTKTTVFAFLFTLPLIVNISGKVSTLAILTNIVVIPMIPLVTLLNLLSLIPFVGGIFSVVVLVIQGWLMIAVRDLAGIGSAVQLSSFSVWEVVGYYGVLILGVFVWRVLREE